MSAPRFDPTLNLGHLLQIAALLVGGIWFAAGVQGDQAIMSAEAAETKRRLAAVEAGLGDLARENTRLTISVNRLSDSMNRNPNHGPSGVTPSAGGAP